MRLMRGGKTERYYTDEELQAITDDLVKAVTIPVNTRIEVDHRVFDLSEMKTILENARKIALQDCGCKTAHQNCDNPRDVCISLDKTADELLSSDAYESREITLEEALRVLEKSHEAGLVHMAYTMKGDNTPGLVCSCCACCYTLGSLLRNGVHTQILTSRYVAEDDKGKCDSCGKCVERCIFLARNMSEGELVYDQTKCFGCGLCVSTCPPDVISLVPRLH
ncbi:MAG: 4Fe-4S binding protein [Candidatus Bathyarchaeota archaeon]|nr:4Fe-4S binding protein [Candidatus Bathyarchaeota archaeon]